ncbi:hypothetical protein L1887_55110 [Cichorium endivia]|nr:hypothetical protein L1887_55110 [Cichorium endivia]
MSQRRACGRERKQKNREKVLVPAASWAIRITDGRVGMVQHQRRASIGMEASDRIETKAAARAISTLRHAATHAEPAGRRRSPYRPQRRSCLAATARESSLLQLKELRKALP